MPPADSCAPPGSQVLLGPEKHREGRLRRILAISCGNEFYGRNCTFPCPGLPSPAVPELGHSFLSFPIFFGLTARIIPLRSGLRVFCFHGSSPNNTGPSHKADASLRLPAPSLSLVPPRKRGRKKGKGNVLSDS